MNVVNKLLSVLNNTHYLKLDKWTLDRCYQAGIKKWVSNILPVEVLSRSLKDAVSSIVTMCECYQFYEEFPDVILTPNYGDNWGRFANYIEINNRAIAEMYGDRCKNGILSSIKLLPAIPPSAKSWANCVILSQIFPNIYGDGYVKSVNEENSIYGIKLNSGYSQNIIDFDITDNVSPEEQFRAFNDIAHFHGVKTGFRTVISADQIKISVPNSNDIRFDWDNEEHLELWINETVNLINLGFEAIFVDSAKHIGNYDMENYTGIGALPSFEQVQYMFHEIRRRSGKTNISIIGEKTSNDFERFKSLGFTTGTSFLNGDSYEVVKHNSKQLKYDRIYAPGVDVSDDNYSGGLSYEQKLNRINTALFAYEYPSDKLASFMQMEDLFPLRYDTNTHHLMMCNPSYSTNETPKSHWENLFAQNDGRKYNAKVGELFLYSLNL